MGKKNNEYRKYFKTRFQKTKTKELAWKIIAAYLQKIIPIKKSAYVLDLGAGYCTFINNIGAREKHALDTSKIPLKNAKRDVKKHIGNCTKLNFKTEYFDVIFASNLLEHLTKKEIEKTLKECHRVLKKNGKLVIQGPNYRLCKKEYFEDKTHKTILDDKILSWLLKKNNFEIEKIIPAFLPLGAGSIAKKESIFINPIKRIVIYFYVRLPIKLRAKQMLILARKG